MQNFHKDQSFYKIVEYKDGVVKSVFHSTFGNKEIPFFDWIQADIKTVSDGSRGTKYKSGWHVFKTYEEAEEYLKKFKNLETKAIARCKCYNLWPKSHSRADVWLAEMMYLENITTNFSWKREERNKKRWGKKRRNNV